MHSLYKLGTMNFSTLLLLPLLLLLLLLLVCNKLKLCSSSLSVSFLAGGSGSGGGGGGGGGGSGSGGSSSDISKDHCNKTVDIFEDISSPEVNNQNLGRPLTCWYRFRTLKGAPRDFVLRLRFKKFKVGQLLNATHCEGGYLQVSRVG